MENHMEKDERIPYMMSVEESASYFNVSRHFIRNGIKNGSIPHMRSGQKFYVHTEALRNLLDSMCGVARK